MVSLRDDFENAPWGLLQMLEHLIVSNTQKPCHPTAQRQGTTGFFIAYQLRSNCQLSTMHSAFSQKDPPPLLREPPLPEREPEELLSRLVRVTFRYRYRSLRTVSSMLPGFM